MSELVITFQDSMWETSRQRGKEPEFYRETLLPKTLFSLQRDSQRFFGLREFTLPDVPMTFFPALGLAAVTGVSPTDLKQTSQVLRESKMVKEVVPSEGFDLIMPVGGYRSMDLCGPMNWHHSLVKIDTMQSRGLTGRGVTVGVLDSGVDVQTPQLNQRVVHSASFDAVTGTLVDQPMMDPVQHGTFVSGIISGKEIGVAPEASLVVGRIAPNGQSSFVLLCAGLEWIASHFPKVRVINISVGRIDSPSSPFLTVVQRLMALGKLLVCAIGNDGPGTSRTPGNIEGTLGVGAVDMLKQVAPFSAGMQMSSTRGNYIKPDLVMPGVSIPSCLPGGRISVASGTSMAAPMLTGLAALLLEAKPDLDVATLRTLLLGCCSDLPDPPERDGAGLPEASRL